MKNLWTENLHKSVKNGCFSGWSSVYWNVWRRFSEFEDHSISFWTRRYIQEIMGEKLRVKGCGHYSRLNCPSGDKRNFKGRWFLCSFRFSKGLQQRITKRLPSQIFHTLTQVWEVEKNFAHFLDVLCPVFDGHSRVFSFSLWLGMRSSIHHFYDINIFIIITVLGNHQNIYLNLNFRAKNYTWIY